MIKSEHTESGITLFEVLLYVALFGLIFVTILQYATTITQFNRTARERTVLGKQILFVDEHIRDTVARSMQIQESQSIFNANMGTIQLDSGVGIFRYLVSDGRLLFFEDSDAESITDPSCRVTRFYLEPVMNDVDELMGFRLQLTVEMQSDEPETRSFTASYLLGVL